MTGTFESELREVPAGDNYLYLTSHRGHPTPHFKWRTRYALRKGRAGRPPMNQVGLAHLEASLFEKLVEVQVDDVLEDRRWVEMPEPFEAVQLGGSAVPSDCVQLRPQSWKPAASHPRSSPPAPVKRLTALMGATVTGPILGTNICSS